MLNWKMRLAALDHSRLVLSLAHVSRDRCSRPNTSRAIAGTVLLPLRLTWHLVALEKTWHMRCERMVQTAAHGMQVLIALFFGGPDGCVSQEAATQAAGILAER